MSVTFYDNALLEKLKKWTNDTDLHIYGTDDTRRLFEVLAEEKSDQPITLPILCVRRVGGYTIINPNKTVLSFDAVAADKTVKRTLTLNAIPINIEYQLDIYSKFKEQADEYSREIVFNIINNPSFKIEVPYNDLDFVHNATLRISPDVEDNSDIPERLMVGQFTRFTLHIYVDDAYLWDVKNRLNKSIESIWVKPQDCDAELVIKMNKGE